MLCSWFWLVTLSVALPALLYWLYWRWTHRRMLQLAALIPGPPALPVLGNALHFITRPEEQLKVIGEILEKYGNYVRIWLGPDLNIVVKEPADIRMLLTSNKINQKGPLYQFLKPYIGTGLLAGGPKWRNHRKIVTPSYNKKSIQRYTQIFNRETEELARVLYNKDPNETFDVYFDVVHCTTLCVLQTLLGLSREDSVNVNRLEELVHKTYQIYDFVFKKMSRYWLQIPMILWLTGNKAKEDYYVQLVDEVSSDIVARRRRAMENEHEAEDEVMSVIDRCLLNDLSLQEVKWETFAVFTTCQEASAKIASAVLVMLAHLPDWQEKVYNEIYEILGPEDQEVTDEQVKHLKNLDMVYKEALRCFSIGAFIQRTVEEEVTVNNGKLTLPAGASVIFPIHILHRDPHHWSDPDSINPDRFRPENVSKRNPNAFVPFSLGTMDCLGRVFATALIKMAVVRVLRAVQLEADGRLEDLELKVAISVKFAKGYNLRARPRTQIT